MATRTGHAAARTLLACSAIAICFALDTAALAASCPGGVRVDGLDGASNGMYAATPRTHNGAPVYIKQDGSGYLYVAKPGSQPHRTRWAIQNGGVSAGDRQAREFAFGADPWTARWLAPIRVECVGGAVATTASADPEPSSLPTPEEIGSGEGSSVIPRVGGSGTVPQPPVLTSTSGPSTGSTASAIPSTCALPEGLGAAPGSSEGADVAESGTLLTSQDLPRTVSVGDARLNLDGEATIEFRVKADWDESQLDGENVTVLRYGGFGANAYVPWSIEIGPGKDRLVLFVEDENAQTSREVFASFADGREHHVAITTDGFEETRVYVDGALVDVLAITFVKPRPRGHSLHVGRPPFQGEIGRLRIWARQLSASEVAVAARKTLQEMPDRSLLVAYLDPGATAGGSGAGAAKMVVVSGGSGQSNAGLAGTWLSRTHPILERYRRNEKGFEDTFQFLPQTLVTTVPTSQGIWLVVSLPEGERAAAVNALYRPPGALAERAGVHCQLLGRTSDPNFFGNPNDSLRLRFKTVGRADERSKARGCVLNSTTILEVSGNGQTIEYCRAASRRQDAITDVAEAVTFGGGSTPAFTSVASRGYDPRKMSLSRPDETGTSREIFPRPGNRHSYNEGQGWLPQWYFGQREVSFGEDAEQCSEITTTVDVERFMSRTVGVDVNAGGPSHCIACFSRNEETSERIHQMLSRNENACFFEQKCTTYSIQIEKTIAGKGSFVDGTFKRDARRLASGAMTARDFIEQYGTHYVHGATLGGRRVGFTSVRSDQIKKLAEFGDSLRSTIKRGTGDFDTGVEGSVIVATVRAGTTVGADVANTQDEENRRRAALESELKVKEDQSARVGNLNCSENSDITTSGAVYVDLHPIYELLAPPFFDPVDDHAVITSGIERLRQQYDREYAASPRSPESLIKGLTWAEARAEALRKNQQESGDRHRAAQQAALDAEIDELDKLYEKMLADYRRDLAGHKPTVVVKITHMLSNLVASESTDVPPFPNVPRPPIATFEGTFTVNLGGQSRTLTLPRRDFPPNQQIPGDSLGFAHFTFENQELLDEAVLNICGSFLEIDDFSRNDVINECVTGNATTGGQFDFREQSNDPHVLTAFVSVECSNCASAPRKPDPPCKNVATEIRPGDQHGHAVLQQPAPGCCQKRGPFGQCMMPCTPTTVPAIHRPGVGAIPLQQRVCARPQS